MTTSLAQQLGQLKSQQKDEIKLPSRVKISFLFDIKQAANIDDQTLFYICQSGITALEGVLDLASFQSDILNERSLQFYRGTETAETLAPIDERLALLLKLLAPHVLESACHKILEYLIRIYDVHVYHKTLLLNAFLPYFETAYFLRMIQLLNLEDDQEYGFLHQFAYQGIAIDKVTLVKCLGRNSGLIFIKYAEFSFSLLDLVIDSAAASAGQHWKFFGSMMVEILRSHSGDQNLMFNCLPYISKSLKQQTVRDLQISGFLAISQLACRKTLSIEYTQAFVRQILQTVSNVDIGDEDLRLKGLTVLLFLAMYQTRSMTTLTKKDFKLACKVDDLPRLMELLSTHYDTSGLAKVFLMTMLRDETIDLEEMSTLIHSLIKGHLKTTYVLIQAVIYEGIEQAEAQSKSQRVQALLQKLKELQPHEFNQSAIYMLKRLQADPLLKQSVLAVLSGGKSEEGRQSSNLISTFGDQEYSILNALSSAHKQTKLSALQALQEQSFLDGLLENERALVKLVLLQTLSQQLQTPDITKLMVDAVISIRQSLSDVNLGDTDFECLETLLDRMHSKNEINAYPVDLKEHLAELLVNEITVSQQVNQIKQIWIAMTFNVSTSKLSQAKNAYFSYLQAAFLSSDKMGSKSPRKIQNDTLVERLIAKPIQAVKFILEIFNGAKVSNYLDIKKIASLLMKLGQKTKTNMMKSTFTKQLYIPLLQVIQCKLVPHADTILAAIVSSIPAFDKSLTENQQNLTCVENILKVAVQQKQLNPSEFNFAAVLQALFDTTLGGSKTLICDFLVQTAIESDCQLSRVFACLHLTKMHQNFASTNSSGEDSVLNMKLCLNQEIAAGLLFILLNDESSVIRQHAMGFAKAFESVLLTHDYENKVTKCFEDNSKITSQAKRSSDKFAPLLKETTGNMLKTLLKVRIELIQDRNQLSTTIRKVKNQEVFEHLVRSLSDYPTFSAKSKLVSVLSLVPQQSLVFAMNLCKVQDKLFAEMNEETQKAGKMEQPCLNLLIQLASLVASQHQQSIRREEAAPELMVSLVLPYLQFITEKQSLLQRELMQSITYQDSIVQLKDSIVSLFDKSILVEASLKDQEDRIVKDIFRLYLSLQAGLLKGSNEKLKSLFIDAANLKFFTGSQLAMVLESTSSTIGSETQSLDILLETIVQVQINQSKDLLNSEAISVIRRLIEAFCSDREGKDILASDFAFTIELASQLCLQTLSAKRKQQVADSDTVVEALANQIQSVLTHTIKLTEGVLTNENVETQDPFNEFMASGPTKLMEDNDNDMDGSDNEDDLESAELLPSYQILLSLMSMITKIEASMGQNLSNSSKMLKEISLFVSSVSKRDTRQVIKQKALTQGLFQLYQSAMLKTANTANQSSLSELVLKDCLFDYTELVVELFDGPYEELIKDGRVYLQALMTAGFPSYAFLASMLLISRATKDLKLQISETLEIDCSTPKSSGAAIYLLKQVLMTSLDEEESLSTIELLTYAISQVKFSDEIGDYLDEKTRLVFSAESANPMRQSVNSLSSWTHSTLLGGNQKFTRKFLYLAICILEQWLGGSPQFQSRLAKLAGTENPSPEIQTQLVNCFLSSYLIAQVNTTMLNQVGANSDKSFKNSLLRLSRNTKKLQQALNEMFSLQIHVEIVLQILDFGEGEDSDLNEGERMNLIPLKNNCLQLLNEKISSYNQGFLTKASKPLQSVFKKLIERSVDLLRSFGSAYKQQNLKASHLSDISALCESLMAVLQYTCCAKTLPRAMQTDTLEIVQTYQAIFSEDTLRLKLMQLQTQLTLTEFYLFEAYALSILEHLPAFFNHVVSGFVKVKEVVATNEQILFADTFQSSLLKATISIVSIFFKFLNAKQLEELITAVATTKAASSNVLDESSQVSIVLDTIGQEAKAHKKLTIHATFNAYQEIVTKSIGTPVLEKQAQRYFSELLCPVLKNLPAKFIQEHSKKFITFLKECFSLPYKASKQAVEVSDSVQDSMVECFNAYVVKLSEEQLRPTILSLVKWAMKEKDEQEFDFYKALMLCKLLSGVLETLKEFFVPLLAIFYEAGIFKIMITLTKLLRGSSAKRSRAEIEHSDVPQELLEGLLTQVCRTLQLCFRHDSTCFIQNDTFEKLCDPVADLLTVLKVSDFMGFVDRSLKPLVFEMDDRINDDAMWIKLNLAVLMKTRSEQWQTRQAAMLVVEHLLETLRERYLVVLNDTIPFLSELLEDEHEEVEGTAKRIVERVEQMTGESIHDYLK